MTHQAFVDIFEKQQNCVLSNVLLNCYVFVLFSRKPKKRTVDIYSDHYLRNVLTDFDKIISPGSLVIYSKYNIDIRIKNTVHGESDSGHRDNESAVQLG